MQDSNWNPSSEMIIEENNDNYQLFIGSNEHSFSNLINFQKSNINNEIIKKKYDPRLTANFYQINQDVKTEVKNEIKNEESTKINKNNENNENKTFANVNINQPDSNEVTAMEIDSSLFNKDFISFNDSRDYDDRKIHGSKKIKKLPRQPFDFKNNKRYLENKTTILYAQTINNDIKNNEGDIKNYNNDGIRNNNSNYNKYNNDNNYNSRTDYNQRNYKNSKCDNNHDNNYDSKRYGKKSSYGMHTDMNEGFFEDFENRLSSECKKLPIFDNYKEILFSSFIEDDVNNQVTVISGDTGCGKSTQVPKYIFLASEMRGKRVKIICTQPRRMAALNLSKRVSQELGKSLGTTVGYQISLDSKQSESTAILYVTNGIFLQRLIHEKDMLDNITHVILDEVHERDIDSDFIMIAIKHLLHEYPSVKLILMSATINVKLFTNYFSKNEILNCLTKTYDYNLIPKKSAWNGNNQWDDLKPSNTNFEENDPWLDVGVKKENNFWNRTSFPILSQFENYEIQKDDEPASSICIPSARKNYEVKTYYLETMKEFSNKLNNTVEFKYTDFDRKRPSLYMECVKLAIEIIKSVIVKDESENKKGGRGKKLFGSFLVFLPGLNEINNFIIKLEEHLDSDRLSCLKILPLHSALSDSQNEQIFNEFWQGENIERKIIVSTNIAESSITVPDVVYVIDFCLSKETTYNPYSSIEKLELAWSSQASCRQRAGRAGRVSDGYNFRLVPQNFYNDKLSAFTTPELLRSPLDKLILRIKTINEDDPKNIFDDPQKVLGRAIQPPHIDNISYAYKSLQDNGALTWSLDNSYRSCKITEIGKIYCDLPCDVKICRMCVMGFVFNCLMEAVTIASILQHQKTMFVMNSRVNPREQSEFYKNISKYDRGFNSDLILMMNVFCEWEEKFRINANEKQNVFQNYSKLKFSLRRNNLDPMEKDWCKENYLDPIILREIYFQREDLKQRLIKYNFQESYYRPISKDNQELYLKLKILFAASFNNNFLKAKPKIDLKLEKKLWTLKNSHKLNTRCALIVTYTGFNSEYLSPQEMTLKEKEWYQIFSNYGQVDKIKFNYNEAYIIFNENSYENAIKFLLYKKALNNNAKNIFKNDEKTSAQKEFYSRYDKEQHFFDQLGVFDYLHLCQFNDLLRNNAVVIDVDSINKFVLSLPNSSCYDFKNTVLSNPNEILISEQNADPRILNCFDYQERNNSKHYTRYTTLLPDIPLLSHLLLLIFTALPKLRADHEHKRYEKVRVDENEVFLDYYLNDKDIDDINQLRSMLRNNLSRDGLSKTPSETFWNLVKELVTKERIKYYELEIWEESFQKQTNKFLNLDSFIVSDKKKISSEFAKKFIADPSAFNQNQKERRIIEYQLYLPDIEKLPLENAMIFDISKEEGRLKYKMYQESYNQWKLKILEDLANHRRFLEQKQTFLCCGRCRSPISDIKNLREKDPEIFFIRRFMPNPYDVISLNYNTDDDFCSNDQYFEVDELFGKDLEYYGCRNNHIVGIRPKNADVRDWFIYVTEHSNLMIIFPDLSEERFDFYKFDIKNVLEVENQKLKKKKQILLEMRYECQICQVFKMNCDVFLAHIKDDKKHKENLKEFQNSLRKIS